MNRGAFLKVSSAALDDQRNHQMKPEDAYLKFVRWNEEDGIYVGYCPDLFPWGGVCHESSEEKAYRQLCALVREELKELGATGRGLPVPKTRAMREAQGEVGFQPAR